MSLGLIGILLGSTQLPREVFPPYARNIAVVFLAAAAALSGLGIATGVGTLLLRKWARILILIWGGFSVAFGIFGGAIAMLAPLPPTPGMAELTAGASTTIRVLMFFIYGAPTLVGIWWLMLFNHKSVKSQFAGLAGHSWPPKPRPPLPIAVLAWFFVSTAAHVVLLPFFPFPMPVILFGHLFGGTSGTVIQVFLCIVLAMLGVGLLKLRPWSYSATIGLQLVFLVSAVATVLSPAYPAQMAAIQRGMIESMHLPPDAMINLNRQARWPVYIGVVIPVAVLVLLFCFRRAFLSTTQSASSATPASSTNP